MTLTQPNVFPRLEIWNTVCDASAVKARGVPGGRSVTSCSAYCIFFMFDTICKAVYYGTVDRPLSAEPSRAAGSLNVVCFQDLSRRYMGQSGSLYAPVQNQQTRGDKTERHGFNGTELLWEASTRMQYLDSSFSVFCNRTVLEQVTHFLCSHRYGGLCVKLSGCIQSLSSCNRHEPFQWDFDSDDVSVSHICTCHCSTHWVACQLSLLSQLQACFSNKLLKKYVFHLRLIVGFLKVTGSSGIYFACWTEAKEFWNVVKSTQNSLINWYLSTAQKSAANVVHFWRTEMHNPPSYKETHVSIHQFQTLTRLQ